MLDEQRYANFPNPLPVVSASLALGFLIAAFDQVDEDAVSVRGTEVPDGMPGEIVVTAAFPTMLVKFMGDDGS
jgi:acetoacetyl-CoA synthetase